MFKKLFGTAVAAGIAALGVKVVKDILDADAEDEKDIIELETEENKEENKVEE